MAATQWKNSSMATTDPAILALHPPRSPTKKTSQPSLPVNSPRETGVVDKLQASYGFIQCYQRDSRLFFHFTEFRGDLEQLSVGDAVEFQLSFDRRNGKPVAVEVIKISLEDLADATKKDLVTGKIVVEARPNKNTTVGVDPLLCESAGRVSYEQCGETFFIPYLCEDVEGGRRVRQGDQVAFLVSTRGSGTLPRAMRLRLMQAARPKRYQGVVCSLKDGYGFIERSDVVREIFFHYSEFPGDSGELMLGDDTEFSIQTRNGKEVAVDLVKLPANSVVFEDVCVDVRRGRIVKTLKQGRGRKTSDPLAGRIVYETVQGSIEIPYGDKDQAGDYTLQVGDLVDFFIATDRRDKLQRATDINLVSDTFKVTSELRERGVVSSVKDGYGFIRCVDREARMFFHFTELMEASGRDPKVDEEVEFTVVQDPASPMRQIAIRIRPLPQGSISFDTTLPEKLSGTVMKEPNGQRSPSKIKDSDPGIIMYNVSGTKQTITYEQEDVRGSPAPREGDTVEFNVRESRKNNTRSATNVSQSSATQKGYVATLKDTFGFIETYDHMKEIFFHFSCFDGDPNELDLGDEVEFTLARKTNKVSAESVKRLPRGTIPAEEPLPGVYTGRVVRSLRILNPDQEEYCGLVQCEDVDYPYGITGLADKRDIVQRNDQVRFRLARSESGGKLAVHIIPIRKYIRAKVDTLKSEYGFLDYEAETGRKLFFHQSEVDDGSNLSLGDEVEFVLIQNQRNGKYSAVSLRKLTESKRPDRLLSRLKSTSEDTRITLLRKPRGPDGTKGFTLIRKKE